MQDTRFPAFALHFRRYAPFKTFGRVNPLGGSFEGDVRTGPSTDIGASCRTYGCVVFNQFGILNRSAGASPTTLFAVAAPDVVDAATVKSTAVRSTLSGPKLFGFKAHTEGSNPVVPLSPNIDTTVSVRIDFGSDGFMKISGGVKGDNFPNLEVFITCLRSKNTALLVDGRTTGGRDTGVLFRLPGGGKDHHLAGINASLPLASKGTLTMNTLFGKIELP